MSVQVFRAAGDAQICKLPAYDFFFFGIAKLRCLDSHLSGMHAGMGEDVGDIGHFVAFGESYMKIIILTARKAVPVAIRA